MKLIKAILTSIGMLVILSLLLGLAYPFMMIGLGKLLFPFQANGSLVFKNGQVIGSAIIGQDFASDKYFHGRPAVSDSSNAPMSKAMINRITQRVKDTQTLNKRQNQAVPIGLITDSGSGIDPDISPEAAYFQAQRISGIRGIPLKTLNAVIGKNIKKRFWALYGEPTVNVLSLNIALDSIENNKLKKIQ